MGMLYKHFPSVSAAINTIYRSFRLYLYSRSLKAWVAAGSHFWLRMRGIPAPTFVTIAVTYRCQVRCDHCYANSPDRPREDELTTEQLKSVIKQVKDLGAMAVHFSGGEPIDDQPIVQYLVNEDMQGLFQFAEKYGYQESPDGYISKCDLCLAIRKFLFSKKDFWELRPKEFYEHTGS